MDELLVESIHEVADRGARPEAVLYLISVAALSVTRCSLNTLNRVPAPLATT